MDAAAPEREPDADGADDAQPSRLEDGVAQRRTRRAATVLRLLREGEAALRPLEAALAALEARGALTAREDFPAFGLLVLTGSAEARAQLRRHPSVRALRPLRTWQLPDLSATVPTIAGASSTTAGTSPPGPALGTRTTAAEPAFHLRPADAAWHLQQTGADEAWRLLGSAGEGVVVAIVDSGVDGAHPLLRSRFRGRGQREQDYHWFDAIATGSSPRPIDPLGHGTHVAGLVAGRQGEEAYGVAPGVEWIAARVFDAQGVATDLNLLRGAAWVLAPTRLLGDRPRPELAPDIVNGSWALDNGADPLLDRVIETWLAADILPVFAAGNLDARDAPWPRVLAPAGHPEVLAVGGTMRGGRHWPYARTGPGFHDGIKPDLAAPAAEVPSAWPGAVVKAQSGTSMASPQVAGGAAVLLGAAPGLRPVELSMLLRSSARDAGEPGPDGRFGHGEMDLRSAALGVLDVGALSGRVLDAAGGPVAAARIRIEPVSDVGDAPWVPEVRSDAQGRYALPLPAGSWSLRAETTDRASATEPIEIRAHERLLLDLVLAPLPEAVVLRGRVLDGLGQALPAVLRLEGAGAAVQADAEGRFELGAAAGAPVLLVSAPGHRGRRLPLEPVSESDESPRLLGDIVLSAAPSILLVDADAWDNERIHPYLARALSDRGYAYDLHLVDDLSRVPDPALLRRYDLVIWAQDYGSPGLLDRRRLDLGLAAQAVPGLVQHVAAGGRLLLSGQEVALHDFRRGQAPQLFDALLGVELLRERSLADPRSLRGVGVLAGLDFELTAPRGAAKLRYFAPDVIAPVADAGQPNRPAVEPILVYPDGSAAATGRDDEGARLAYLAFGPESGGDRDALADLFAGLVTWLTPPRVSIEVSAGPVSPGETITATLSLLAERFDADASLELGLPDFLVHTGPDDFQGGGSSPTWAGSLPGDDVLRLQARLTAVAGQGDPPSRLEARWTASGQRGSTSADVMLFGPKLRASRLWVEPGRSLEHPPDAVTVTLRMDNTGLAEARGARAAITLPMGFDVISDSLHAASGVVSLWPDGGGVDWRGDIAPSAEIPIRLRGRPNPSPRLQMVEARIFGEGFDVSKSAPFAIAAPELSTSDWIDPPASLTETGAFSLRFRVANTGASPATALLWLSLPEGVRALEPPGASRVFWTGDVPEQGERPVVFELEVADDAVAGAKTFGLELADTLTPALEFRRPLTVQLRRPDLGASRLVMLPATPRAGGLLTTTLLVGNRGDARASASIVDSPSPELVPLAESLRVSGGSVALEPGAVYWQVGLAAAPADPTWSALPFTGTLAAGGTRITARDASGWSGPVELGIPIPFGEAVYTHAWISGQGALALGGTWAPGHPWQALSSLPASSVLLAPFWVDPASHPGFEPRLIRERDRVSVVWHHAGATAFALEMHELGAVRFAYGALPEPVEALVGLRTPSSGAIEVPLERARSGRAIRIEPGLSWQRLSYRATLGSSSEPNRLIAHTVRLEGDGATRVLTASLPVNRISLRRSTLDAWPLQPTAGASLTYTLSLVAEGDVRARQVEARVDLPASLSLDAASLPIGLVHDADEHTLAWRGDLDPGSPRRLSWRGRVDEGVRPGGRVVTQAMVQAAGVEATGLRRALRVADVAFRGSRQRVSRPVAWPEEVLGFQLQVANAAAETRGVTVTDALPEGLEMIPGSLRASTGPPPLWDAATRSLLWAGAVPARSRVDLRFEARFVSPRSVLNVMRLVDDRGHVLADGVEVWPAVAGLALPFVDRSAAGARP